MSAIKEPQKRITELETELAQLQIFRQFAEASGQGLGMGTLDGRVVYMNPTLCRLVGAEKLADTLNQPFALYYPEEMQQRLQNEVMPAVMQQGQWTGELALTNGDIITPTLENFFIIRDNQGQPLYLADVVTDITEQKLTEAKIEAEVETRTDELAVFRALVENATDGVMLGSLEGKFSYANRAAYELYGYNYEKKEIVGLSVADINPAEMMPAVAQEIMPTIMRTGGWQGETKQCRKEGTIFDIYLTTFLIKDETGQPTLLAAIVRDLTNLKQKEAELHRLGLAIEQTSDGVALTDLTGKIQFANPSWARMHGYEPDELIGQHLSMFHTPEQLAQDAQPALAHAMQTGAYEGEVGHQKKDGSTFPTWMTVTLIKDETGQPIGLSGTVRDITAQKKAEQAVHESERRFRGFAEASGYGFGMGELSGQLTFANPALIRFMDETSEADVLKNSFFAYYTATDQERLKNEILSVVLAKGQWVGEISLLSCKGRLTPTEQNIFLIYDEHGQPHAVGNIITDISERRQTHAERERLQEEVIEAQRHAIAELSTPVIPIMDNIIVMPLIGSIDTMRARDITRTLLAGITQNRAKVVILDVTGVAIMDTGVVNHLNKTIQAARLKGARTIVTGISDAVAEAIVDLGIDWSGIETLNDLQTGLVVALGNLGIKLQMANSK